MSTNLIDEDIEELINDLEVKYGKCGYKTQLAYEVTKLLKQIRRSNE